MRALMVQGIGSDVGKSLIVAGLCRAARNRGISVAPFKPQNMSNNAAVTVDGGEIGRAQAVQALAAGVHLHSDMNPVLIKPQTETGAQVIVQGRRMGHREAGDYMATRGSLLVPVMESFARLKAAHDLVIVEGAGSPAEVNLRKGDIANMGFARAADCPVVLLGDIDRGGVIAQIVGTQAVLDAEDAALVAGFIVNRLRGDVRLFDDGYRFIADRTGWRGFGVVPWFADARLLPAEDALDMGAPVHRGAVKIAWLALSRVANFDDLDPLKQEPGVHLVMVRPGQAIPGDAALVIIPGTKSTRGDLAFLRAQGWDVDLTAHHRRGGRILGLCGGYQMLGQTVADPLGVDGDTGATPGLGLLDVETVMAAEKRVKVTQARHAGTGQGVQGYEIHMGVTSGADCARPFAEVDGAPEGAVSGDGLVEGSYLHGLFTADAFRTAYLATLGVPRWGQSYGAAVDAALDRLAAHLEQHLDVSALLALAR
ncbi:MAG: cobyric acid synthase [Paracoccaceae bacterium]